MNEIKTLEEADNVATRIAELELEIKLTNTRFDLRRRYDRQSDPGSDLCSP